jgi:hypothetical protein
MPPVITNLRLAINTLMFIALSVFALEPTAIKDRRAHSGEAGFQEIEKAPIYALASVHGKVEIRKVQGVYTPDLLAVAAQEGAIKSKLRLDSPEFFAGANSSRVDLGHARGRAPPAA